MSKTYPCYYSSTTLMSFMSAVFSSAFAFFLERDLTQWKLGWDVRLLTVAYAVRNLTNDVSYCSI